MSSDEMYQLFVSTLGVLFRQYQIGLFALSIEFLQYFNCLNFDIYKIS